MAHTMNLSLRVCTGLLAFLALFFCPTHVLAQAEITDKIVLNWTIVGRGSDVLPGERYTLVNKTLRQSIRYGQRGSLGGINLVWDTSTNLRNFTIEPKSLRGHLSSTGTALRSAFKESTNRTSNTSDAPSASISIGPTGQFTSGSSLAAPKGLS